MAAGTLRVQGPGDLALDPAAETVAGSAACLRTASGPNSPNPATRRESERIGSAGSERREISADSASGVPVKADPDLDPGPDPGSATTTAPTATTGRSSGTENTVASKMIIITSNSGTTSRGRDRRLLSPGRRSPVQII